jgi:hypothetical protein
MRNHPLIARLREISASLRRIARTDRLVQREAKKGSDISQFYEGAIQAGTMAARLIDEAVRQFSLSGRGRAGAASAPFFKRKGRKA